MNGYSKLFVVLGLICAVNSVSVQETCKTVKNNTYIANPDGCNQWIYCLNGQPYNGICPGGLLFNVNKGMCDYSENVMCRDQPDDSICNGVDAEYLADPSSCNEYIYCVNGEVSKGSCPKSQVYNPELISCVIPSTSFDCSSRDDCKLVRDNTFLNDDSTCEGYIQCVGGKAYPGQCRKGYFFNPTLQICDYEKNVNCQNPSKDPSNNEPAIRDDICSQASDGYVSDEATCRGAVNCLDKKKINWTQCKAGTHFNAANKTCVNTDQTVCNADRCDGLPDLYFVAVMETECLSYTWCKGGRSSPTKTKCSDKYVDYPYFDEVNQICVKNPPKYPICD